MHQRSGIFFVNASHVVADFVSFATAFSFSKQTPPLIHSVAPPLQLRPASLGSQLAFLCRRWVSILSTRPRLSLDAIRVPGSAFSFVLPLALYNDCFLSVILRGAPQASLEFYLGEIYDSSLQRLLCSDLFFSAFFLK